jgi:hypothetical protein
MRFDMSYAAAVSDPRIADESMTSELFSGLEGSNIGFLFPVFAFSRKGNSPPYGPRVKGAAACFIKVEPHPCAKNSIPKNSCSQRSRCVALRSAYRRNSK